MVSPACGAAHVRGQVGAQLADPDHVYRSVHKCTHGDWSGRARRAHSRAMNFAFSEEQEELRKTVRAFLEAKRPETEVRELMETDEGYDPAVWAQMAEQLGLQGLHIPEEYGGSGFTLRRARHRARGDGPRAAVRAVLLDGRARRQHAPARAATTPPRRRYLPGIASGETIATLAFTEPNGQVGRGGHHDGGHGGGRRLHARPARRCSCSTATPPT